MEYGGNWYRAVISLGAHGPYPANAYGDWELNFVRSNTTLTIGSGQGFADLLRAWTFAKSARIADTAYLHLQIVTSKAAFTQTFSAPFSLDHGSGALISISGDNPSLINLTFKTSGFTIDGGHALGGISNVSINGPGSAQTPNIGITASTGASILSISNTYFSSFNVGVFADSNANIAVGSNTRLISCYFGMSADHGATIVALGIGFYSSTPGDGLFAIRNGVIDFSDNTLSNADTGSGNGALAEYGGFIDLAGSTVENWDVGADATDFGHIKAGGGIFQTNTTYDIAASFGGGVEALGAAETNIKVGNGDGSYVFTS